MNTAPNPYIEHIPELKERTVIYAALPGNMGVVAAGLNSKIVDYFMDLSIIIDLELNFSEKDKKETSEALLNLHQQMIRELTRLVEFGLINKEWMILHLQNTTSSLIRL